MAMPNHTQGPCHRLGSSAAAVSDSNSDVIADENMAKPGTSMWRAVRFVDSSCKSRPTPSTTAAPIGTLMMNISRQVQCSRMNPPRFGPMMLPIGCMLVSRPIACARRSGYCSATMPTDDGTSPPPPTACTPRAKIRNQIFGAIAHSSEPNVKIPTHTRKTRLRPNESLSLPDSGSMINCTNWYEVSVQETWASDASKLTTSWGMATATIV
jgi:hypothetical protein